MIRLPITTARFHTSCRACMPIYMDKKIIGSQNSQCGFCNSTGVMNTAGYEKWISLCLPANIVCRILKELGMNL